MNENNVFVLSEKGESNTKYNNNPCIGHETGLGHYKGDNCGCEKETPDPNPPIQPTVSIDGYLWVLVVVAVILIKLTTKK